MLEKVGEFSSLEEARVAVAFLEANDIEASLADVHTTFALSGVVWLGSYRVLAPRGQAEAAKRLLTDARDGLLSIQDEQNS